MNGTCKVPGCRTVGRSVSIPALNIAPGPTTLDPFHDGLPFFNLVLAPLFSCIVLFFDGDHLLTCMGFKDSRLVRQSPLVRMPHLVARLQCISDNAAHRHCQGATADHVTVY